MRRFLFSQLPPLPCTFASACLLLLCKLTAVRAWMQVIVTETDDGSLNWTTINSTEDVPQVAAEFSQFGQMILGAAIPIMIGGPSPMTGSNDKTLQAAAHVRAAVQYWMEWVVNVKGNDIGVGFPVTILASWMDDQGDAQGAANATAWLARYLGTSFFISGVVDDHLKWSALQTHFDGNFVMSPGASDPTIYEDLGSDKIFGLMPPPANKVEAELAALVEIAVQADDTFESSNEANICGSAGCASNLAVAMLGECSSVHEERLQSSSDVSYLGTEVVTDETGSDDLISALERLQAKGVTVLRTCGLSLDTLKSVTKVMEDLNFDVFALLSDTVSGSTALSYSQLMANGWYQGAWIMDATVWHPKYPTRGALSQMTSAEFATAFRLSSGLEATPYAASAFACLLCFTNALQETDWDLTRIRDKMRNTSLDEFFGHIEFDEYGQNTQPFLVTQYSNLYGSNATINIVHPFEKASSSVVFPRPSWAQLQCRFETAVLQLECSGNGLCDRSGACICEEGWTGSTCATEALEATQDDSSGTTLLLVIVFSACGCLFFTIFSVVVSRHFWKRRQTRVKEEKEHLARAIEQEDKAAMDAAKDALSYLGITPSSIAHYEETVRREQSEERGIRLSYILSDEFLELARARTGKDDPTFYDMKDKFFFGEDALGKDTTCPRDGKPGVALVDWVGKEWRGKTTHFLSWTWGYKVSLVRDALEHWTEAHDINPDEVCLFMCFFVNNQYRIIVSKERIGAEELEHVFESNLTRIGQVVALLDTWDNPRYLTRIWTIFEQAMSIQLNVPVTMVLPRAAAASLVEEFNRGKDGILRVKDSLTNVHAESAEAFSPDDEKAVKALILKGLGFASVDDSIFKFMTKWVGLEMEVHMRELVHEGGERIKRAAPSRIVLDEVSAAPNPLRL